MDTKDSFEYMKEVLDTFNELKMSRSGRISAFQGEGAYFLASPAKSNIDLQFTPGYFIPEDISSIKELQEEAWQGLYYGDILEESGTLDEKIFPEGLAGLYKKIMEPYEWVFNGKEVSDKYAGEGRTPEPYTLIVVPFHKEKFKTALTISKAISDDIKTLLNLIEEGGQAVINELDNSVPIEDGVEYDVYSSKSVGSIRNALRVRYSSLMRDEAIALVKNSDEPYLLNEGDVMDTVYNSVVSKDGIEDCTNAMSIVIDKEYAVIALSDEKDLGDLKFVPSREEATYFLETYRDLLGI